MKPEDVTTSPWGRGTCRVCGRPFNLLKSDTAQREHRCPLHRENS